MESHEKNDGCQNKVEYRCDAFSSEGRILLRSIKFVEEPSDSPGVANQFDMTYCVIELSADEAGELAGKLMAMSRSVPAKDNNGQKLVDNNDKKIFNSWRDAACSTRMIEEQEAR